MTKRERKKREREDLMISIDNATATISAQVGREVVDSVFKRYGAHDTWDLDPSYLSDVFNELYAIEADLR